LSDGRKKEIYQYIWYAIFLRKHTFNLVRIIGLDLRHQHNN